MLIIPNGNIAFGSYTEIRADQLGILLADDFVKFRLCPRVKRALWV